MEESCDHTQSRMYFCRKRSARLHLLGHYRGALVTDSFSATSSRRHPALGLTKLDAVMAPRKSLRTIRRKLVVRQGLENLSQLERPLRFERLEDRQMLSITVDTLVDENDGSIVDGDISLRDAIVLAPTGETIDFSVIGTLNLTLGELLINKSLSIHGPGEDLLTIDASGNDPTPAVNEGNGSRVINIHDGATLIEVSIVGLTLTGGDVLGNGGGIYSSENMRLNSSIVTGNAATGFGGGFCVDTFGFYINTTLSDVVISNNIAGTDGGGIRSRSFTTVTRSTITGNSASNGGGIHNLGDLLVSDSTVNGNTASSSSGDPSSGGGGIWSRAKLTVTGSTISNNSTSRYGGGIATRFGETTVIATTVSGNSAGGGGGISIKYGPLTVIDSTISANVSSALGGGGGGIRTESGTDPNMITTISNSTLSGNLVVGGRGAGVHNFSGRTTIRRSTITNNLAPFGFGGVFNNYGLGTTEVYSSIIAGNGGSDVGGSSNSFSSNGHNLIGIGSTLAAFNQPGDQTGVLDPLLDVLADNGGPTFTHALRLNSSALDAGDPTAIPGIGSVPLFDQRGEPYSRANGPTDIGAFELIVSGLVVDTLVDENDGDISPGDISLREAIAGAANGTNITFSVTGAINLSSLGQLTINKSLTINGPGANLLTINGFNPTPESNIGDGRRVFNIDSGSDQLIEVEIVGLTVSRGDVNGNGGGIRNLENLTLTSVVVSGNAAADDGGGIWSSIGRLEVIDSMISGNVANSGGGGIQNYLGKLLVRNSTISGNSAVIGGGIRSNTNLSDFETTVVNSTISGNAATFFGGGLFNQVGLCAIRYSTFTANSATYAAGIGTQSGAATRTELAGAIIAGNAGPDVGILFAGNSFQSLGFNLVGAGNAIAAFNQPSDQIGVLDLKLGPLADNGGPTKTHALLSGSPAIDAGDPAAVAGVGTVPEVDQRGVPFTRVIDGDGAGGLRIDIGAYELHILPPATPTLLGDYNLNGAVDAADYVVWRKTLDVGGVAAFAGADGSGNGVIDQPDYDVWRANYGSILPPPGAGSGTGQASSFVSQELQGKAASKRSMPSNQVGGSVVLIPTKTMSASANTNAAAAQAAGFAVFDTRSLELDSSSRSHSTIHRYQEAESGDDALPLLLAIDRVWRTQRQDSLVNDDNGNGKHRAGDHDFESNIDELLFCGARCTVGHLHFARLITAAVVI